MSLICDKKERKKSKWLIGAIVSLKMFQIQLQLILPVYANKEDIGKNKLSKMRDVRFLVSMKVYF